jgi:hypothetical protein
MPDVWRSRPSGRYRHSNCLMMTWNPRGAVIVVIISTAASAG